MLALDVTLKGYRAAHLEHPTGQRPRLVWCEEEEIASLEAIQKFARHRRVRRHRLSALLPRTDYQLLLVEAPNVPPDELKAAMRWRIKDMIDYHVDDAVIDVLDIPPDGEGAGRHFMYAVTAHSGRVQDLVRRMGDARLPLEVIDIPEMAQRNLAKLAETPHEALAMLTLTEDGGLITVNWSGELYLARRIELRLSQLLTDDEERLGNFIERIVLEVQRSIDHFERQFHTLPLSKLMLGPLPDEVGLKAALASNLELPVEDFDLTASVDCAAAPDLADNNAQNRMMLCIGAALRQEEKRL
jgi:MSHA biogenesis protein MshI